MANFLQKANESIHNFFLGGTEQGAEGDRLQGEASSALQELARISRQQFEFFRSMAQEFRDFVVDSPLFQAIEKEAVRLTSEAGQTEEAARFRASTLAAQDTAREATERRQRSFGLDRSSGLSRAVQAGQDVAAAGQLAGAGTQGRRVAFERGAGLGKGLAEIRSKTFSPAGIAAGTQGISNVAQGLTNLAGQQFGREAGERDRRAGIVGDVLGIFSMGGQEGGEVREERLGLEGPSFAGQRVEDGESKAAETDDRVPAQLSAGEYVATAEATKFHGQWLYDWLEEAARRGIPGIPKFMQKLDMSEVPERVAGEEPAARAAGGGGVDFERLKGGADLVNEVTFGKLGLFPREVRAQAGGEFSNEDFFEIIDRGRRDVGLTPEAPRADASGSSQGRDAGITAIGDSGASTDVRGPGVGAPGDSSAAQAVAKGAAGRRARANFGISSLPLLGENKPLQPIVRTG